MCVCVQAKTCYPSIYRLQKTAGQKSVENTLEKEDDDDGGASGAVAMATLGFTYSINLP